MQSQPDVLVAAIPGFSEPFSSLSHLLMAGLFLVLGGAFVIRNRGEPACTLSVSIFVFGVVFLLSVSGVYHLLAPGSVARAVLQRLDHAAIFVLIAASFTPIHVIVFRGISRWGILLLVWAGAVAGITLKTIYFEEVPEGLGTLLYLGLGWVGALSGYLLYRRFGFAYMVPVLVGGLAYSVGALLEYARYPVLVAGIVGPHEIFHILVLVGIFAHWVFIRRVAQRLGVPGHGAASGEGLVLAEAISGGDNN
jgi:channel protein (hemolysin III family)